MRDSKSMMLNLLDVVGKCVVIGNSVVVISSNWVTF